MSTLSAIFTPSPELPLFNILPPQLKKANSLLTDDATLLIVHYELKLGRKRATLIIPPIKVPPRAFCARRVSGTANFYLIKGKTRGGCLSLSRFVLAESPSLSHFTRESFNCLQLRLFNCYTFGSCVINFLNLLRLSRVCFAYFQREKDVTPSRGL